MLDVGGWICGYYKQEPFIKFSPYDTICVDKIISHLYAKGRHWINIGLPMYISFDRKT